MAVFFLIVLIMLAHTLEIEEARLQKYVLGPFYSVMGFHLITKTTIRRTFLSFFVYVHK